MDQLLSSIRNASEEYSRLSARISAVLEGIGAAAADPEVMKAAERIEAQIRSMDAMSASMQDIASVYENAGRSSEELKLPGHETAYPEFGISEFASLARHEKLMPIHME